MDFTRSVIKWYGENKRVLPWRETTDPYRIWVSEVILQQTRVEQGISYYWRFLDQFPDVESLAMAPEDEVMKVWQGLGYYSRARNMIQAARDICRDNHSEFPSTCRDLIRLKGIGDYSASAIASIAFHEPCPAIDGNVLRVMTRFTGISQPVSKPYVKKQVREILNQWIDHQQPGTFNQAVMELGALVCTPRKPLCAECPLSMECYAFRNALTSSLPVMERARPKEVHHYLYFVFLLKENNKWFTWLNKRTGKGIWKGLYDFPLVESSEDIHPGTVFSLPEFLKMTQHSRMTHIEPLVEKTRHILSHRDLRVTFLVMQVDDHVHPGHLKISLEEIRNYPVSRLIENFLKKLDPDRVYF